MLLRSTTSLLSLRRVTSRHNTIVALCKKTGSSSESMSLDVDIRIPHMNIVLLKNMGRRRDEPAQKCLERLRILLSQQPGDGKKKGAAQRTSRETLLTNCPAIEFIAKKRQPSTTTGTTNTPASAAADSLSGPTDAPPLVAGEEVGTEDEYDVSLSDWNEEFWSRISHLVIGDTMVRVLYNIPTVTHLSPPTYLAVGLPVMCSDIRVLFATSPTEQLQHEWRRSTAERGGPAPAAVGTVAMDEAADDDVVLSRHRVFVPGPELLGTSVVYRCKPMLLSGSSANEEAASFKPGGDDALWTEMDLPPIQPALPRQDRWRHLQSITGGPGSSPSTFRVMSYNILHDDFCTSKFAKLKLYPFATDDILSLHYRKSLIAQELLDVRPDIFCLQECGQTLTDTFLRAACDHMGYDVAFSGKNGLVREGCLTGYQRNRWALVTHVREPLVMSTLIAKHPELAASIQTNHPHLDEAMQRVTSVGAVTVLRDRNVPGKVVVVGNTHLFYHPNGCHVRALQAFMFLHLVEEVRRTTPQLSEEERAGACLVLAGDFNFTRCTGGYKLVTTGAVDEANTCWEKGYKFWWGCDKALGTGNMEGVEIEEDHVVASAVQSPSQSPPAPSNGVVVPAGPPADALKVHLTSPFGHGLTDTHLGDATMRWTNYALGFKEIIDHIFVDGNTLRTVRTVPLPTEAEVSAHVAIPSPLFPSDHVSLVCDLDYCSMTK